MRNGLSLMCCCSFVVDGLLFCQLLTCLQSKAESMWIDAWHIHIIIIL